MARKEARETKDYFNVLADGKFHINVPEGTEGAVTRTYKTSTGEEGSKLEKVYESLSGKINSVELYEGDYGKNIILNMEDEDGLFAASFGCSSNFGEDVLKKILNVDMEKDVDLVPFSFLGKNGKNVKGVNIYQGGAREDENKVFSYFHDYNPDTKETTIKNGYPKAPTPKKGKVISSDEWKLYFATARLFMIDKVEEKFPQEGESDDKDF